VARLVATHHRRHRAQRPRRSRPYARNQRQQAGVVPALQLMTRDPVPLGTAHHRQPRLLAQFDRHENRAIMVRDGRANVRCVHLTSPMVRVCKPNRIGCTPIAPWDLRSADYLRPNHRVAMPRKEKNPTTSVTVVTNGPDDTAGSTPRRIRISGMRMPPSAAAASTVSMASPMTMPRSLTLNQVAAITPMITAKASPLSAPTMTSRAMMRRALARLSSRVASARTATVMVWVPALPPMLATIGMSTASDTIFCSDPSNRLMTHDASSAVSRLANSQVNRPLAMDHTG